jgi:hypothetical protein
LGDVAKLVHAALTATHTGNIDFSLVGILSRIWSLLAENGIGLFAVSTFNTDYIFTKSGNFDKAPDVLRSAAYEAE